MPVWVSILECIVKALIWGYGHEAVVAKVAKYTPLKADPNPPPVLSRNPNVKDHFGGL